MLLHRGQLWMEFQLRVQVEMEFFMLSVMVEREVELLGPELVDVLLALRLVKKVMWFGSHQMGPKCLKVLRQGMNRCCLQSLRFQLQQVSRLWRGQVLSAICMIHVSQNRM